MPKVKHNPADLLDLLRRLNEWQQLMGKWEAPVWCEVESVINARSRIGSRVKRRLELLDMILQHLAVTFGDGWDKVSARDDIGDGTTLEEAVAELGS